MAIYTRTELVTKIRAIDAAMDAVLLGKSYELDTGQGRQKVTRQDVDSLLQLREYWERELEALAGDGLLRVGNCDYKNGLI